MMQFQGTQAATLERQFAKVFNVGAVNQSGKRIDLQVVALNAKQAGSVKVDGFAVCRVEVKK